MRNTRCLPALAIAALIACDGVAPQLTEVRLYLTDAPAPDIASAEVWISRAYLVPADDGDVVTITETPQTYDLLTLQGGVSALLGAATVAAGQYAQLRLVVDSARLTLGGGTTFDDGTSTKTLTVPSGLQTGIKVTFPAGLDLPAPSASITVDFDVTRNFVLTGPPAGPHGALFTPLLVGTVR